MTALRAHAARVRHPAGSTLSRPLKVLDGIRYPYAVGLCLHWPGLQILATWAQVLSAAETWDYWAVTLAHLLRVCDVVRVARWADLKAYLLDLAAALPGALARSALHCAISGRRPGGCGHRIRSHIHRIASQLSFCTPVNLTVKLRSTLTLAQT